ncbi:hypothetical protein EVAR_38759_1 [Eumeta japonica]|uniref:Uncharacterized protein n=1 Tax=Eumeta variegata TaxID=151549 RepID=A0A4C1WMK1_EUMVA|nr:hypothetical protein EVAR_38759_1 [Eumeta japonica]
MEWWWLTVKSVTFAPEVSPLVATRNRRTDVDLETSTRAGNGRGTRRRKDGSEIVFCGKGGGATAGAGHCQPRGGKLARPAPLSSFS